MLEDKIFATAILYRAWRIIEKNPCACAELAPCANLSTRDITCWELRSTAPGCYNTANYFNRSSDAPNCHLIFEQKKIVVKALRFMKEGEELRVAHWSSLSTNLTSEYRRYIPRSPPFTAILFSITSTLDCFCIRRNCSNSIPRSSRICITTYFTGAYI